MSDKTKPRLKAGDLVYRVVENIDGDGWLMISRRVKTASDRQIELEGPFPLKEGRRFKPHVLGSFFHATPEGAALHFLRTVREDVASANRKIIRATNAMAWVRAKFPEVEAQERAHG